MTKASFKISGTLVKENLVLSLIDFQNDEYAIHYQLDTASIFMFDQFKRALPNFAFNVILDNSKMSPNGNEMIVQCFALGAKNRSKFRFLNQEKSTINDLYSHMFWFSNKHNCNWEIGELNFE